MGSKVGHIELDIADGWCWDRKDGVGRDLALA